MTSTFTVARGSNKWRGYVQDARPWHQALLLSAFALVGRSIWAYIGWVRAAYLYQFPLPLPDGHSDASEYLVLARNIAYHCSFSLEQTVGLEPTSFRAPLYPALIALFWWQQSPPIAVLLIIQALLASLTVGLTYLLARDRFNPRVAVIAGVAMALAPLSNQLTGVVITETLYTFLLVSACFAWGRELHSLAGALFGLSILTRPTTLPFILFLVMVAIVWRSKRRALLMICASALIVSGVWVARNAIVFHRFIPVASAGGGNSLLAGTVEIGPIDSETRVQSVSPNYYVAENDRINGIRALAIIRRDPLHWMIVRAKQYPRLFLDQGYYLQYGPPPLAQATRFVFIAGNIVFMALALYGIYLERQLLSRIYHILLLPAFLCGVLTPMWVEARYSVPIVPMIIVMAAVATDALLFRSPSSSVGRLGSSVTSVSI